MSLDSGGFQFGTGGPKLVASLGAGAADWHHYTYSWNANTNVRDSYIDGVLWKSEGLTYPTTDWLDHKPHLHLGCNAAPCAPLQCSLAVLPCI